jgi:hypothetical protein
MAKPKMIDIDAFDSPEFEIKIGGRVYKIGDPKTFEAYKLMKYSRTYQEANTNLESKPDDEVNQKVYEGSVRALAEEGLKMFNDDVDLSDMELRKVEALAIKINELTGEAFMKGRGLGI